MTREKVTAYLTPDLADALRRQSAAQRRSVSDLIEDAVLTSVLPSAREAEHAVLLARLDIIARRLWVIERSQEIHFELTAHAARFAMSVTPDIPEGDRMRMSARGGERFANVIEAICKRLAAGRSVWRDHFLGAASGAPAAADVGAASSQPRVAE